MLKERPYKNKYKRSILSLKINLENENTKKELDIILKRIDKAGEYFKNQPYNPDIDETKEYKLLRQLIKTAAKLQGVLNKES